mmetsp:Transcript_14206/g.44170  ORF Transcript_14206/g.44170 Transcript_14206/m.44170 type:complete len:457 (-) Transcript_14206:3710-5080(-)
MRPNWSTTDSVTSVRSVDLSPLSLYRYITARIANPTCTAATATKNTLFATTVNGRFTSRNSRYRQNSTSNTMASGKHDPDAAAYPSSPPATTATSASTSRKYRAEPWKSVNRSPKRPTKDRRHGSSAATYVVNVCAAASAGLRGASASDCTLCASSSELSSSFVICSRRARSAARWASKTPRSCHSPRGRNSAPKMVGRCWPMASPSSRIPLRRALRSRRCRDAVCGVRAVLAAARRPSAAGVGPSSAVSCMRRRHAPRAASSASSSSSSPRSCARDDRSACRGGGVISNAKSFSRSRCSASAMSRFLRYLALKRGPMTTKAPPKKSSIHGAKSAKATMSGNAASTVKKRKTPHLTRVGKKRSVTTLRDGNTTLPIASARVGRDGGCSARGGMPRSRASCAQRPARRCAARSCRWCFVKTIAPCRSTKPIAMHVFMIMAVTKLLAVFAVTDELSSV